MRLRASLHPLTLIPLLTMIITGPREREQDYGYLSYQRHVVLGLDEVDRLVRTVTDELGTRGLTTPFLFSSLALDVNSSGVRRLIQAFLRTCVSFPTLDAERTWREEARFAAPPELAMCLRWGLARVLRVSAGHAARGLISWDMYVEWSEAELRKLTLRYGHPHSMLIPPFSARLSYNTLRGACRTSARATPCDHRQRSLPPCTPNSTFFIIRSHPSHTLSSLRTSNIRARSCHVTLPSYLPSIPPRYQRDGTRVARFCSLARCT